MSADLHVTQITAVRQGSEISYTIASGGFTHAFREDELDGNYEALLLLFSDLIESAKAKAGVAS
jgi:hypothetical protein